MSDEEKSELESMRTKASCIKSKSRKDLEMGEVITIGSNLPNNSNQPKSYISDKLIKVRIFHTYK